MSDVWKAMETTSVRQRVDESYGISNAARQDEEDAKFTALVDRLERLGRLRKSRRKLREQQKQMELDAISEYHSDRDGGDDFTDNSIGTESSISSTFLPEDEEDDRVSEEKQLDEATPSSSPPKRRYRRRADMLSDKERRDQQQLSMMEEFNGPCVVCLEPDAVSKAKLVHLRQLLCEALPGAQQLAAYYTPSASSPLSIVPSSSSTASSYAEAERQDTDEFRPVIPIASFETVTEAIAVARTLRRDWEPLTFNVTDFHLISSCGTTEDMGMEEEGEVVSSGRPAAPLKHGHWDTSLLPRPPTTYRYPFGCDALVSLIGEEVAMDDDLNYGVAQMVAQKGTAGGFNEKVEQKNQQELQEEKITDATEDPGPQRRKQVVRKPPSDKPSKLAGDDDITADPPRSQLEEWLLEEDEAYDEGVVVVMGRVQMFTGEMREYVGMPASKNLGDIAKNSKMSRRTTVLPTRSQFSQHTVLDAHAEQRKEQFPSNLGGIHE